jgi:hypothetical protein
MPERLPDYADRFICIARLNPRWDEGESWDRYGLCCTRCHHVFWAYSGDSHFLCKRCGMRCPTDRFPTPDTYGYFLEDLEGYTPGGGRELASPTKNPRA